MNQKFPCIAAALKNLPDDTEIDGELVALGRDGRPDFNLLQNFRSAESRILYDAFDMMIHKNRNLTKLPLSERRAILRTVIEPSLGSGQVMVAAVIGREFGSAESSRTRSPWISAVAAMARDTRVLPQI